MKTSERAPLREPAVSNDPLPPRSVRAGAGSRRRAVILAAALMVVASASTGVGVYAWQHAQVRDRDAALLTALQERDEADREAAALRGDAVLTSGEVAALQARVQHLRARVDGLRSTVADLSQQFGSAPSCNAADMLAAIRDDVDIAPSMVWESVSIQECQNGYARVYAHPGHVPVGSNIEDSEQVFLRHAGDVWTVITSGTGITCSDSDLSPEMEDACRGLGLR